MLFVRVWDMTKCNNELENGKIGKWTHELISSGSYGQISCRILKTTSEGGSVLFMTDVTVFYMTMLRRVTNHFFYICWKKPLKECVDTFSVMQLWVLLTIQVTNALSWWRHQILRVTGHLWGEFTGHGWIPRTKASDAGLWCILWSAPEYKIE